MRRFARDAIELVNLVHGSLIKFDAARVMPALAAIATNPCTVTSVVLRIVDFAGLTVFFFVGTLCTTRRTDVPWDCLFFRFPSALFWI